MKQSDKSNKYLYLMELSFFLALFLPACVSRQVQSRKEEVRYEDTSVVMNLKREEVKRQFYLLDTTFWQIRQMEYTAPDSDGRQYPCKETLIQVNKRYEITDTSQLESEDSSMVSSRVTLQGDLEVKTEAPVRKNRSSWLLVGIITSLIVVGLWKYSRRRIPPNSYY